VAEWSTLKFSGQLWQGDLAFVGTRRVWNGYVGFLLVIDCFSVRSKVCTCALYLLT
jgi:hypothetical protein